MLRHQQAFVKPPQAGTYRRDVDVVLHQWSQEVLLASMLNAPEDFRRMRDLGPLSTAAITQAVEGILNNFDGIIGQDDVFFLIYPESVSHLASSIRGTLLIADESSRYHRIIGEILFRKTYPFTYWFPTIGLAMPRYVKMAFIRSDLFLEADGANGWRLLKHSPTHPILTWYLPPQGPMLSSEATLAIADTVAIEGESFALLQEAIKRTGTPIRDVVSHPNGMTEFPDYRAVIGTQHWSIEITRPLGQIVHGRIIAMGTAGSSSQIRRAALQPSLGFDDVRQGLEQAISDKSTKRQHVEQNERYCLLLVDTIGAVDPDEPTQWKNCELDAFDSVVLLGLIPERASTITWIKGDIPLQSDRIGSDDGLTPTVT